MAVYGHQCASFLQDFFIYLVIASGVIILLVHNNFQGLHRRNLSKVQVETLELSTAVKTAWLKQNGDLKDLSRLMRNVTQEGTPLGKLIHRIAKDGTAHYKATYNKMTRIGGGTSGENWRKTESEKLGMVVQNDILTLQNPSDCLRAKRIVCDHADRHYGFEHYLLYVAHCLMLARAMNRTVILKSKEVLHVSKDWEDVLLPLSNTCTSADDIPATPWSDQTKSSKIVHLPLSETLQHRPDAEAIPIQILLSLRRFHSDPIVWWHGQFLKYASRLQPDLQRYVTDKTSELRHRNPVVGVQISRTEKVLERKKFSNSVANYMTHVHAYFKSVSMNHSTSQKRVYLVTDDTEIVKDIQHTNPSIKFIIDTSFANLTRLNTRFSKESLKGVMLSLHRLASSDYIVCNLESNICRAAYELMQTTRGDATDAIYNVSDEFME